MKNLDFPSASNERVHFKLSLYNLSVIARQLVVEAIQCKRCILDCFVPRNDGMRQFEMHPNKKIFLQRKGRIISSIRICKITSPVQKDENFVRSDIYF